MKTFSQIALMIVMPIVAVAVILAAAMSPVRGQDGFLQTPTLYNTTLTSAGTEYSRALPTNTKKVLFQERTGTRTIRYCYTSTCTSGTYMTLQAGSTKSLDAIDLAGKTLYFQDPTNASTVIETEVFTDE